MTDTPNEFRGVLEEVLDWDKWCTEGSVDLGDTEGVIQEWSSAGKLKLIQRALEIAAKLQDSPEFTAMVEAGEKAAEGEWSLNLSGTTVDIEMDVEVALWDDSTKSEIRKMDIPAIHCTQSHRESHSIDGNEENAQFIAKAANARPVLKEIKEMLDE